MARLRDGDCLHCRRAKCPGPASNGANSYCSCQATECNRCATAFLRYVELATDGRSSVSKANGVLYQLSGSTEVSIGNDVKVINPGEGLFIGSGKTAQLKASSGGPSTFLHFFLVPATDLDAPAEMAPAIVKHVYRTTAPIPDLKPGGYDLNLTRVTFPAGMPSNAPHHRSGAAL